MSAIPRCWTQEQCLLDYAQVFTSGTLLQAGIPRTVLEHHGLKYCASIENPFIPNPLLYFMHYVNDLILFRHLKPNRMSLGRLKSLFLDAAMTVKCKHRTYHPQLNQEFLKPKQHDLTEIFSTQQLTRKSAVKSAEDLATHKACEEGKLPVVVQTPPCVVELEKHPSSTSACGVSKSSKRKHKKTASQSTTPEIASPAEKRKPNVEGDSSSVEPQLVVLDSSGPPTPTESVVHEQVDDYADDDDHPLRIGLRASRLTSEFKLFGGQKALTHVTFEELLSLEDHIAGVYAAADLLAKTKPCSANCKQYVSAEALQAWLMYIQFQVDPSEDQCGIRFRDHILGCDCKLGRMLNRFLLGTGDRKSVV